MRNRFLRFPGGKPKAVTFSYDDGEREDIRLAQIINRYGIKCTFNINSDFVAQMPGKKKLALEEIKTYLLDAGHEVAVHGANHRALGKARAIDGITDVLKCRVSLEKAFGIIVRGMAYPGSGITVMVNNASYENIRQYLKNLDIAYARTIGGDNNLFMLPTDWYAWMPTAHHDNPKVLEYAKKFVEIDIDNSSVTRYCPRLFYLWGHSYEFEHNDNWDLLETLCEILGRRDDIWYATNIEIYEYVQAYNSLVYSADGSIVYNPTFFDVWFDVDQKLYKIKPGETLILNN